MPIDDRIKHLANEAFEERLKPIDDSIASLENQLSELKIQMAEIKGALSKQRATVRATGK